MHKIKNTHQDLILYLPDNLGKQKLFSKGIEKGINFRRERMM